jgi:ATP-dependent DNA helicase PIF1
METLTPDQRQAFNAIHSGKNIFLTGPAGTGKSYLLKVLTQEYHVRIALTAMTGCAAILLSSTGIKAKTLHSWAGVGLAKESVLELTKRIRNNYHSLKRWLCTDLLVIDEISMITPEFLEKLNEIAKVLRKSPKPFGGIQLLFVGDFYQLPPVSKDTVFAFESPIWSELVQETHHLTTITRQKEPEFQEILMEARVGKLSEKSINTLKGRMIKWDKEEIKPTLLFSRRAEVDRINEQNLRALTGERRTYKAKCVLGIKAPPGTSLSGPGVDDSAKKMDNDGSYVAELELALGAQVMLVTNIDTDCGLANGSRGVLVGYSEAGFPVVKFRNNITHIIEPATWQLPDFEHIYRSQIPLRLAYAITCHKAQGATLDCALIDIGPSTFEYGQAYVALSRVKSLDSLYVHSFDHRVVKAHPKVIKFYSSPA